MFLVDEKNQIQISYEDLICSINKGTPEHKICQFIACIVNNIDVDFSKKIKNFETLKKPIIHKLDLIERIKNSESSVLLNTSGTTGKPKSAKHLISKLLKTTKVTNLNSTWALTYNPAHMGGIQVLLQALINGDKIVYLYKRDRNFIIEQIKKHSITHISATPSFYRLLMPVNQQLMSVKRVTVGGELSQKSLFDALNKAFSEATINNIYATTETGAILFSRNEIFVLNDSVKIKNNTLYVKTAPEIWQNTGDRVKIISNNPTKFVFIGRNSDIINVGGNNVNPNEIEEALKQHPMIKNVIVYGKKSSLLGNILSCDVVLLENNITSREIIAFLKSKKFADYKIPRFINFKNRIEMSDNLKALR